MKTKKKKKTMGGLQGLGSCQHHAMPPSMSMEKSLLTIKARALLVT